MPDLLLVFVKRWKWILGISFLATMLALVIAILSPKKYLSVATALPANSLAADKARIFNSNIEALYSEIGTPDDLDRIEGSATLDTVFIAASNELHLSDHYLISDAGEGMYKAAMRLKKNTRINRSSYGELKVRVWDADRHRAAEMANFLMKQLQELHQNLQIQTGVLILGKIKSEYELKQKEYSRLMDSVKEQGGSDLFSARNTLLQVKMTAMTEQFREYEKLIGEYQLAVRSNVPVLLIVENARPALWPDKPRVLSTVLFSLFGTLVCACLVALFVESRKQSR